MVKKTTVKIVKARPPPMGQCAVIELGAPGEDDKDLVQNGNGKAHYKP